MTLRNWLTLGFLSVIWGASFFFIEVVLTAFPPLTVVALRVTLAALALASAVAVMGIEVPRQWRDWRDLAIMGLINNAIPFTLIVSAQTEITSSLASILNATTPIFAVILTHAVGTEKITWPRGLGVIAGFLGAATMLGLGGSSLSGSLLAQVAVLGAALLYASSGLYGRRLRHINPVVTSAVSLGTAAIAMIPLAAIVDAPWTLPVPSLQVVAAIVAFALVSTALGYIIFYRLLREIGPTNLLLITFLVPASAILQGSLFLGDVLSWHEIAGMALIVTGLLAIDGRIPRWVATKFSGPKAPLTLRRGSA